jgi:hypothetical protein
VWRQLPVMTSRLGSAAVVARLEHQTAGLGYEANVDDHRSG